jgi:ribonuclease P protein subunit RPR2
VYEEKLVKGIAEERIERLIKLAYERTNQKGSDSLSARYVRLAREISSHYKVKMKKQERNSFCKKCNSMLIPGKTCTVTLASSKGQAIYKCRCGAERKIFYK